MQILWNSAHRLHSSLKTTHNNSELTRIWHDYVYVALHFAYIYSNFVNHLMFISYIFHSISSQQMIVFGSELNNNDNHAHDTTATTHITDYRQLPLFINFSQLFHLPKCLLKSLSLFGQIKKEWKQLQIALSLHFLTTVMLCMT